VVDSDGDDDHDDDASQSISSFPTLQLLTTYNEEFIANDQELVRRGNENGNENDEDWHVPYL